MGLTQVAEGFDLSPALAQLPAQQEGLAVAAEGRLGLAEKPVSPSQAAQCRKQLPGPTGGPIEAQGPFIGSSRLPVLPEVGERQAEAEEYVRLPVGGAAGAKQVEGSTVMRCRLTERCLTSFAAQLFTRGEGRLGGDAASVPGSWRPECLEHDRVGPACSGIERADLHPVGSRLPGNERQGLGAMVPGEAVHPAYLAAVGRPQDDDDIDTPLIHGEIGVLASRQVDAIRVGLALCQIGFQRHARGPRQAPVHRRHRSPLIFSSRPFGPARLHRRRTLSVPAPGDHAEEEDHHYLGERFHDLAQEGRRANPRLPC